MGQGVGGVVGSGAILVLVAHSLSYLDSCFGPVSSYSRSSSLKLCSSMCNVLESCVCVCRCVGVGGWVWVRVGVGGWVWVGVCGWVRACVLSLSINSLWLSTVLIALNSQQENGCSTPCPDQVNTMHMPRPGQHHAQTRSTPCPCPDQVNAMPMPRPSHRLVQ